MPNHAYTVLRGMQLKNPDRSDGPKLIEIRNPHGNSRYNNRGPWNRWSKNWTADFKEQTGYKGSNEEGVFWFPLELFTEDWNGLNIAHWNDDFKVSNMEGDTKMFAATKSYGKKQYITLDNPVVQDVYLTCESFIYRMFPSLGGDQSQCSENPASFGWNIYSKYSASPDDRTKVNQKERDEQCNGGFMHLESLPVGKYMIPV